MDRVLERAFFKGLRGRLAEYSQTSGDDAKTPPATTAARDAWRATAFEAVLAQTEAAAATLPAASAPEAAASTAPARPAVAPCAAATRETARSSARYNG